MLTPLISDEIKQWFEKSAASELYASRLYQYVANQMQRKGLDGAQSFFLHESKEELEHYQKLADFVNDNGAVLGVPETLAISRPVNSITEALELAYETELELLDQYEDFYEAAQKEEDHITATFLIEFMQIQRKSVGLYGDLVSRLSQNPSDIFMFDKYLSEK
jgi:ferritin